MSLGGLSIAEAPIAAGRADDTATPGIVRLDFATHGFFSAPTDTPPDTYFEPAVVAPPTYSRSILDGSGFGGAAIASWGDVSLRSPAAQLDYMLDLYAIDGRRVEILMGGVDSMSSPGVANAICPLSRFTTIFDNTALGWISSNGGDRITIRLRDNSFLLDRPIQTDKYLGTGGWEGGDDLKGKSKPVPFGICRDVEPIYVGVIGGLRAYDAGPSAIDVPAVWLGQIPQTRVYSTTGIAPGQYCVIAGGRFVIGGDPSNAVTCDVEGPTRDRAANIRLAVTTYGGLPASALDGTSFARFAAAAPGDIGLWIGAEERQLPDVLAELVEGVLGWFGYQRNGLFGAVALASPAGLPMASYDDSHMILKTIEKQSLPTAWTPPPSEWRMGWGRNYTVQTTGLPAGVADARRSFVAQEWRIATAAAADVQARHLLAKPYPDQDTPLRGLYDTVTDAQTQAARLAGIINARSGIYRFGISINPYQHDVGDVIAISHPRYGLAAGKLALVLKVEENPSQSGPGTFLTVFVNS